MVKIRSKWSAGGFGVGDASDATKGNQAFSHDRCNIFPGLSYSKANDTIWIVLEITTLKPKLNLL